MRKIFQMKLYSLLSTKWGMALIVIGLFFSFNSFFQFLQFLIIQNTPTCAIPPPVEAQIPQIQEYNENVTVRTTENNKTYVPMTSDAPCIPKIDIVYTWVNGSDPRQQRLLRETKSRLKGEVFIICNSTQKEGENNCTKDEETASRFQDNDELKYSLRSVEKFIPWVNHIYLVTNGQVPNWLNLTHPKLTVVTHAEIFRNASHLPSFSSPAIESNIHRIPGLADRFIYFNDDTMIGNEVWPDDFYTQSAGQKIYLSWAVPNCNEGCPANWINDGYCDQACNVSDCDYDGEDCKNATSTTGSQSWNGGNNRYNNNNNNNNKDSKYCSAGCPDSWIGDKYCDRACKTVECGWDAGDCDVSELYQKVQGFTISRETTLIDVPKGSPSVYFNLSGVVGEHKIIDGSHDNADLVRTATISQKHKIMTLTFHRDVPRKVVVISITHEVGTEKFDTVFNVSAETIKNANETVKGNENSTETVTPNVVAPNEPTPQNPETPQTPETPETPETPQTPETPNPEGISLTPEAAPQIEELPNPVNTPEGGSNSGGGAVVDKLPENPTPVDVAIEDVNAAENNEENAGDGGNNPAALADEKLPENPPAVDTPMEEAKVELRNDKQVDVMDQEAPVEELGENEAVENVNEVGAAQPDDVGVGVAGDSGRKLLSIDLPFESIDFRPKNLIKIVHQHNEESVKSDEILETLKKYARIFDNRNLDDKEVLNWVEEAITKHKVMKEKNKEVDFKKSLVVDNLHEGTTEEFGPWETKSDTMEYHEEEEENPRGLSRWSGRKLLDHFADSLKFVNKLLNKEFGPSARKVPAHMPHFIDKRVMIDLQNKWSAEFDATSSHQLRDRHDMQYSFSYMYFLAHQRIPFNMENVWREYLDVDHDGILNDNEIRTLAVHIGGGPIKGNYLHEVKGQLLNCTADNVTIDFDTVSNCTEIRVKLEKHFGKKTKNKHQTLESDEVAFLMVNNNATNVEKSLDGIRERRQKFVCLNDNMNHTDPSSIEVVRVLKNFYDSIYPLPSTFELSGTFNEHLWMDEIVAKKAAEKAAEQAAEKAAEETKKKVREVPAMKDAVKDTVKDSKSPVAESGDGMEGGLMIFGIIGILFVAIMCIMFRIMFRCTKDPRQQKREKKYQKILNA